ncbi:glycosyltransferase [bacterium]|nr:glycosyltransferase [bacterium]
MNLLYVITDIDMGGAERALLRLLQHKSLSHNVLLVSMVKKGVLFEDFSKLNIQIEDLGLDYGQISFRSLKKLRRLIINFKPEVIHSWMYHACLISFVSYFFSFVKVKLVWSIRQCVYDYQMEKALTKIVLKFCAFFSKKIDAITYNSKLSLIQHQNLGFNSKQDLHIANGFEKVELLNDVRDVYDECKISKNTLLIGFVGRYHKMKDYPTALEAFSKLKRDFDFHLVFIGKDLDYSNQEFLFDIRQFNLKDRVSLLGQKFDLAQYYSAFDFFVSSSSSEAFPNVLAEAMSYECLCICTDVGDCKEVLGDFGYIVKAESPVDLERSLRLAFTDSLQKRSELCQGASTRIQEEYSIKKITQEYHQLYERLICAE